MESSSTSNRDAIVNRYVREMRSIPEIARELSIPMTRVRTTLLRNGVAPRSHREAARLAGPKISAATKGKGKKPWSAVSRARLSKARTGSGRGFSVKSGGYVQVTQGPHKHRNLHVVIAEVIRGRPLLRCEVVHHIDGNKHNNDPRNLQIMTRSEHTRLHRNERKHAVS